jgi:2-dehydropantoate 2-reductase
MRGPRILVLGAGGIGGHFGGRLAEAGADVTFLVREGRRELLDERGLRIESQFGNVELNVRTVLGSDVGPDYDAVILTCKAYDLDDAIKAIAPALAPSGFILPLLNGVAHIDILNEAFGRNHVNQDPPWHSVAGMMMHRLEGLAQDAPHFPTVGQRPKRNAPV